MIAMKLFHWNRLETCKNYATGDAIIMAPDLDAARTELRKALEAWAAENREWDWTHGDEEDRAAIRKKIDDDVASEPGHVHDAPAGIVISGSQ